MLASFDYNIRGKIRQEDKKSGYLFSVDNDLSTEVLKNILRYYMEIPHHLCQEWQFSIKRVYSSSNWIEEESPWQPISRSHKMDILNNWQKEMLKLLLEKKETEKVYIFSWDDKDFVIVTVENPSTGLIEQYSSFYIDVFDKYGYFFEFLVFEINEIENYPFPNNVLSFP